MATVNIVCDGPGPHIPADGILGTASQPTTGMRCASAACKPPPDPASANADTIRQQIALATQIFENADANWATLTAAQRNDVLKLAVRSLARVGRILNNQLDAT